jgi:hypothetical protein
LLYCSAAVSAYRIHGVPSPAAILIKSLSISVQRVVLTGTTRDRENDHDEL